MLAQVRTQNRREGGRLKGIRNLTLAALTLLLFLLLLFAPVNGLEGARAGLLLCGEIIIPSLFPFLVLSVFTINTGLAQKFGRLLEKPVSFLFRLPGSAASAFVLGVLGGYPVGAKACGELCRKGELSKKEANRLLAFCINSSPGFIIGSVGGGLLRNAQAGILLYCAHLLASLLIGIFSSLFSRTDKKPQTHAPAKREGIAASLVEAVTSSISGILNICAYVVLFSSLSALLTDTGLSGAAADALGLSSAAGGVRSVVRGFLEVTNGCAAAAGYGGMGAMLLLSAVLSWSGISVFFQVMSVVRSEGLSARSYILARPVHMVLSTAITLVLFRLFPVALPVFAQNAAAQLFPGFHTAPGSAALLIVCSLLLLSQVTV